MIRGELKEKRHTSIRPFYLDSKRYELYVAELLKACFSEKFTGEFLKSESPDFIYKDPYSETTLGIEVTNSIDKKEAALCTALYH